MSASLCDTTTEEDIHINDTLVSQGLAIFARDTEEEKAKFDGYQPEPLPQGVSFLAECSLRTALLYSSLSFPGHW